MLNMSLASTSNVDLPVRLLTCKSRDGQLTLGGGDVDADTILKAAESVVRLMVPSMPATTDAYLKRVQSVLATEPLTMILAVQEVIINNPIGQSKHAVLYSRHGKCAYVR
jgi:hypothetical protein